jgi:predicted AAA+ superfamily ATPase
MYKRIFNPPEGQSIFLFGPRGTGKSSWLRGHYPQSNYIDLLDDEIYNNLMAEPKNLIRYVENPRWPTIIDEVQKIPKLLDEVHRLIEKKTYHFILTGSSSRKLKRSGVNLLAGRALTYNFYPLTPVELGKDFKLKLACQRGLLPMAINSPHPNKYLQSYVATYLREEVQQEGLSRNMPAFHRFLQAASFSQGAPLNISKVAADCAVDRKVVEDYFSILQDLLISFHLPIFSLRAKRKLIKKEKFYFFDAGVFSIIRPRGPLDSDAEILGSALETLVIQIVRAMNDYKEWGYELFYWQTQRHQEVDLILYGKRKLMAIEIKSSAKIRSNDTMSLRLFKEDYPEAEVVLLYGGEDEKVIEGIHYIPINHFLTFIDQYL